MRVLRVATTWMSRYGGGSRSCESGHGPFAYMQYTPLCDTSRDTRVEINDDIFNFVERTFSSGKEKKERKKIVSQRRERERKKNEEIVYRAKMIDIERGKGKVRKEVVETCVGPKFT